MSDLTIITNHVPRFVVDACELTQKERAGFEYIDWPAIDAGSESASFLRYRGEIIDLGEVISCPPGDDFKGWHGYRADSFFSGIVVRFDQPDCETAIVGRYYS